jgi:ElaB/YqjD/DUF883 family membrane-anchored ribosome-binding protein
MTTATATKSARNKGNGSSVAQSDLAQEIEGLRTDLSALMDRFANLSDAGIRTAGEVTREKSAEARHRGEAAYAEISARASDLEHQAAESIRRHPLQALGIAAGIGFLAAFLTRR